MFRFVFAAGLVVSILALVALVLMEERPLRGPATQAPPGRLRRAARAGGVGA
jgi:hypothetical protein